MTHEVHVPGRRARRVHFHIGVAQRQFRSDWQRVQHLVELGDVGEDHSHCCQVRITKSIHVS